MMTKTTYRSARTPEREAILRAEYSTSTDRHALLAKLAALPGKPVRTFKQINQWVLLLGLRKTPEALKEIKARAGNVRSARRAQPDPEPYTAPIGSPGWAHRIVREVATHRPEDLTPEQEAEIADAALDRRLERAREMIARKMQGKSAAKAMAAFEDAAQGIIANTRLPAAVVRRLAGEVRMGVGS